MQFHSRQLVTCLCFIVVCLGACHASARQKGSDLVTIETGDSPIILSAPHGGRRAIEGAKVRQGQGVRMFVTVSDTNTDLLAEQLADAVEKKLGARPYLVIARFHRKYLDANRREQDAYESHEAKEVYDIYHKALADARRDVTERWGQGILFDIHAQGADPNAVFRGTQNSKTVTHLVNSFSREALIGRGSFFGQLAGQGLKVFPAVDSTDREDVRYNGGYITRTYGSSDGGTVDTIQLELGRNLRLKKAIPSTADKLANAVTAFRDKYLPKAERNCKISETVPNCLTNESTCRSASAQ